MHILDPVIVAALATVAVTIIAAITAVLIVLVTVRGTPSAHRPEIIDAVARLIDVVRNRRKHTM